MCSVVVALLSVAVVVSSAAQCSVAVRLPVLCLSSVVDVALSVIALQLHGFHCKRSVICCCAQIKVLCVRVFTLCDSGAGALSGLCDGGGAGDYRSALS